MIFHETICWAIKSDVVFAWAERTHRHPHMHSWILDYFKFDFDVVVAGASAAADADAIDTVFCSVHPPPFPRELCEPMMRHPHGPLTTIVDNRYLCSGSENACVHCHKNDTRLTLKHPKKYNNNRHIVEIGFSVADNHLVCINVFMDMRPHLWTIFEFMTIISTILFCSFSIRTSCDVI